MMTSGAGIRDKPDYQTEGRLSLEGAVSHEWQS